MTSPRRRGPAAGLPAIAFLALAVSLAAWAAVRAVPPLRSADELAGDLLIAHFTPAAPQRDDIVLVTLGEGSPVLLACRSPVDRSFLAGLIAELDAAAVRAIGLDILFDRPTLPGHDAKLRRAIMQAAAPVVAVTALETTPLAPEQRSFLQRFLAGLRHGHANLAKDTVDGTVRWHVPRGADGTASLPAVLAGLSGATVPDRPFRIDWSRGPEPGMAPFPIYPADAVGILPRSWLEGRVVLIGTSLAGIDQHRTPLSRTGSHTPGVEIQGHVLAQILDGRAGSRIGAVQEAALVAALAAGGAAVAGLAAPTLLLLAVAVGVVALLGLAGVAVVASGGPVIPMGAPSLAWLGAIAATTAHLSLKSRTERRVLMDLFASHVSQPVAEEIWRERDTFMAGGRPLPRQLTATVLFCDVEGFTTICEVLEPDPLLRWLEGYLDAMVRIVAAHDGIVLRFVGDGILAVFGAPVARETQAEIDADARRSVACALDMGRELAGLNRRWRAEGLPPVGIRIGIETGPLVAGSLGGLRHKEYSLLGDTANTAARLEQLGKEVAARSLAHCRIVIGEGTCRSVEGEVALLPAGTLSLKGKKRCVRAWLVLDGAPSTPDEGT
ncbi:adenylate/guanylate cyclase domain-containing protein [Arenibaculum sp.]|jgi:class 3 adenylate cyclase/CHASE2 domain-containing sensor protein|uniref:adenylate/guanylate cyclase domain-containing protein n=1 Tax=Arenibaculum sp. TaxID=2865862 RepID=UPI002E12CF75|nr:adenylate/guanylate cyclase domain-containing protein [Arenibaculum sp.]